MKRDCGNRYCLGDDGAAATSNLLRCETDGNRVNSVNKLTPTCLRFIAERNCFRGQFCDNYTSSPATNVRNNDVKAGAMTAYC